MQPKRFNLPHLLAISMISLIVFGFSLSLLAETYVHQMKYLKADQIIPVIKPHLDKNTILTSRNNQLVIQSTPGEYNRIKQLLESLDKKPVNFLVELRLTNRELEHWELKGAQSSDFGNNNRIEKSRNKVTSYRLKSNRPSEKYFRLKIGENQQGFMNTGSVFPTHRLVQHYDSFLPQTRDKKVSSGFYIVLNKSPGGEINVSISTHSQSRQNRYSETIQESQSSSRFSMAPDTWTVIGITADHPTETNTTRYATESEKNDRQWYYLKVSEQNE